MPKLNSLSTIYRYLRQDFEFSGFGPVLEYDEYSVRRAERQDPATATMRLRKFELIASLIKPGSSVLDIGCGDGSLLAYLVKIRHIKAIGMDISAEACQLAKSHGVEAVVADIRKGDVPLREGEQVDYIVMSEVLEHIPNAEEALVRLKATFRNQILITVPNTGSLNDRARLLLGRMPKQWLFHPGEHVRFWTVGDFHFWARQLGYRIDKCYGLYDPYYDYGLGFRLWRAYPRLFARYVLYVLAVENSQSV